MSCKSGNNLITQDLGNRTDEIFWIISVHSGSNLLIMLFFVYKGHIQIFERENYFIWTILPTFHIPCYSMGSNPTRHINSFKTLDILYWSARMFYSFVLIISEHLRENELITLTDNETQYTLIDRCNMTSSDRFIQYWTCLILWDNANQSISWIFTNSFPYWRVEWWCLIIRWLSI